MVAAFVSSFSFENVMKNLKEIKENYLPNPSESVVNLSRRLSNSSADLLMMMNKYSSSCSSDMTDLTQFEIINVLGRGTFGTVKLARHVPTGAYVALKILYKDQIVEMHHEKHVIREQTVHLMLNHPFIIKLHSTFQDHQALYFAVEYAAGGELYSLVYDNDNDSSIASSSSTSVSLEEEEAQEVEEQDPNAMIRTTLRSEFGALKEEYAVFYLACMVLALEYLHEEKILYRDLKLENIVVDAQGYPKLIDFGFAKPDAIHTGGSSRNTTLCGSIDYMAPEVLQRRSYDQRADIWAFGILMYELLLGTSPFYHANHHEQGRRITTQVLTFPKEFEQKHPFACQLMNKLLTKDPEDRYHSFQQVREDMFFQNYFPTQLAWKQLALKKMSAPFVPVLNGPIDISLFKQSTQLSEEQDLKGF